jgi:limonene-1,2-epoxide hydrolase
MPWVPDFVSAAESARMQTRASARADPGAQYLHALNSGDTHDLRDAWPGEVVVYDPRVGEIRGHRRLRRFIHDNHAFFAARRARIETVASTNADGRAVLELLVHLNTEDGEAIEWPVAVVVESPDDFSIVFRTYCSQWPVEQQRPLRPAILPPGTADPAGVVAQYGAALQAGDADALARMFTPDGYYREPIGAHAVHRGSAEIRSYFTELLSNGGVGLQPCVVTDDGVRAAVEFNCIQWGDRALAPQAGLGVYERSPDGLLAAARIYDDVEAPASHA